MKSYNSLRIVSMLFKILAYLCLIGGLLIAVAVASQYTNSEGMSLLMSIGEIALTLFAFILLLACSEIIMLFIHIADNVSNATSNIYSIAERIDFKHKQEDQINKNDL